MSLLLSTVLQTRGPGTFLKFIRQPVCSNSEPCTKHNAYGDENTRVSLQFRMLTVNPVIQGWQTYSGKGQIVNILDFVVYEEVSVTNAPFCYCNMEAVINTM